MGPRSTIAVLIALSLPCSASAEQRVEKLLEPARDSGALFDAELVVPRGERVSSPVFVLDVPARGRALEARVRGRACRVEVLGIEVAPDLASPFATLIDDGNYATISRVRLWLSQTDRAVANCFLSVRLVGQEALLNVGDPRFATIATLGYRGGARDGRRGPALTIAVPRRFVRAVEIAPRCGSTEILGLTARGVSVQRLGATLFAINHGSGAWIDDLELRVDDVTRSSCPIDVRLSPD